MKQLEMEINGNSLEGPKKINQLEFDFESTEKKEIKEKILKVSSYISKKALGISKFIAYLPPQTNVTKKIIEILTRESEDLKKNKLNIINALKGKGLEGDDLEEAVEGLEKLKTYGIVKLEELSEERPEYEKEFNYIIENISAYNVDGAYEYFQDFRGGNAKKENISFSQKIKGLLNMIELTEKFK